MRGWRSKRSSNVKDSNRAADPLSLAHVPATLLEAVDRRERACLHARRARAVGDGPRPASRGAAASVQGLPGASRAGLPPAAPPPPQAAAAGTDAAGADGVAFHSGDDVHFPTAELVAIPIDGKSQHAGGTVSLCVHPGWERGN